jgi:type I restriction enzyme, S subunit
MTLKLKHLGDYIAEVNIRNKDLRFNELLGVSIQKKLIPSIANIVGTDMSTYKIIKKNQFAYGPITSRNGNKVSIALMQEYNEAIVSQAYIVFKILNTSQLIPEFLMMWFKRTEFDRYARFMSHGSAREVFGWNEMCNTLVPILSVNKQKKIADEYQSIENRIKINNIIVDKIEELIQSIFKQWFIKFDFPNLDQKIYKYKNTNFKSSSKITKSIPRGWEFKKLKDIITVVDNRGKTPPCSDELTEYPLIEIGAIKGSWRGIDYSKCDKFVNKETYNKWFRSGHPKKKDILFSTVGSLAELKVYWNKTGCIAQNLVSFRCKENIGLFLYQTLLNNKEKLTSYEIGSVQASIKVSQIINFKLLLPEKNIVNKFEKISEHLTNLICLKLEENISLEKMKNLLLVRMKNLKD